MSSPVASLSSSNLSSNTSHSSDTDTSAQASDGREWKKLKKNGARILGICALTAFAVVAIAALAIGIAALVNPVGLAAVGATIGAFVTAGLAFAAENSIAVLIAGSISVGLLGLAGVVTLIANKTLKKDP